MKSPALSEKLHSVSYTALSHSHILFGKENNSGEKLVLKENFDHALANHFKHYNGRDRCVKALCKLLIARSIYVSTILQKKTLKQIFRKELRWTRYSLRLLYCAFHSLSEISFPFFQSSRLSTYSMGWALHWKPTNSYEKKFILCPLEAYMLK